MPQPSFLSDGTTPRRTDSRWFRWAKILGAFQNRAGANPANNPRRTDSFRDLQRKVLGASGGVSCTTPATPGGFGYSNVQSNSIDLAWTQATNPQLDFLVLFGNGDSGVYPFSQSFPASARSGTLTVDTFDGVVAVIIARDSAECISANSNEIAVPPQG